MCWKFEKLKENEGTEVDQWIVDMRTLKNWVQEPSSFTTSEAKERALQFCKTFDQTIVTSYQNYQNAKGKAWSKKENRMQIWVKAIGPSAILSGFGLLCGWLIELSTTQQAPVAMCRKMFQTVDQESNILAQLLSGTPWMFVGIIILWLVGTYMWFKAKTEERKEHYETWVRHSACFHHLMLELSKFVTSSRTDEDLKNFSETTYAVLHQNLDQFVLNCSRNGLAGRADGEKNNA